MVQSYLPGGANAPSHWSHLANTIELVLPSPQLNPQPKWQIDRFSHFCTAHRRVSSSMPGDILSRSIKARKATSAFGLGKRRYSSPQRSYLHHLRTLIYLLTYLEVLFQQTHIRHRIALGKQVFMNKKKLFTGNLSIQLKKRIVKSVLCSVVLYAAESYRGRTVSHNSTAALLPTSTLTTVIHYQNTSVTIIDICKNLSV